MHLATIHRPSTALIKFIEALAIVLQTPTRAHKSRYRVPLPSTYTDCVHALENNYDDICRFVTSLTAADLTNELALQLYNKTQERGFHYKNALFEAGDAVHGVFAALMRLIEALPAYGDGRVRVQGAHVLVPITGNKSSYAALDVGMHLMGATGYCTLPVYVDESFLGIKSEQTLKYLTRDVERRCTEQYKVAPHLVKVDACIAHSGDDVRARVEATLAAGSADGAGAVDMLCVGLEDTNIGLNGVTPLVMWAVWEAPVDVVLARINTPVRPFASLHMPRAVLVNYQFPSPEPPLDVVEQALKFIRPSDYVVFVVSGRVRASRGDNQETRFDYGARHSGATAVEPRAPPYRYHSDDGAIDECAAVLQEFLNHAKVDGTVRVVRDVPTSTLAQELGHIAADEHADLVVVKRHADDELNRSLVVDLARDLLCALVVLK